MNEKNLSLSLRSEDFRQMIDNGVAIIDEIMADARRLAEKMSRIHGFEYRVQIEHDPDVGCIFIVPRLKSKGRAGR